MNWAVIALGIAVLGIEVGFFFAYRSGWNISKDNLFASSIIVMLLLPIGALLYSEQITLINLVGVVCCILGVTLLSL